MPYVDKLYEQNYLEYASYVIKDRAIPDVDDGLKPVQRRILHSLAEVDDGKFHKVVNIIGNTMKYHPHGDQSIEGALIVLAQKDYLIEKQGNFGNIFTGDEASAARYIECRLTDLARDTLLNKSITEYVDTYDSRNKEPVVFPAKIPLLVILGTEGIAVGMSTRILPHNFCEVVEAQIGYLKGKNFNLYPDFPTGGVIIGRRGIAEAYREGLGATDGITLPEEAPWASSAWWLYTVLVDEAVFGLDSRELLHRLANAGIQTRPIWQPLHLSKAHGTSQASRCEVAQRLNRDALSLPSSVGLTPHDQKRVIDALSRAGCQTGQGYFYGKPMPLEDLAAAILNSFDASQPESNGSVREPIAS